MIDLVKRVNPEEIINMVYRDFHIPDIDLWDCPLEMQLFRHIDKAIIVPVGKFFGVEDPNSSMNYFYVAPKRCYNKPEMRVHLCKYINYFVNFFDTDLELYTMYAKIKYMIDQSDSKMYNLDRFLFDLKKYILFNKSLLWKIFLLNEYNYKIELKAKKGRSVPSLQYRVCHGKIFMQMSLLINMIIPLVCHFVHMRNIDMVDDILLEVFDTILYMSDADMYAKLYETASIEVERSNKLHKGLWDIQPIRGISAITHVDDSIDNIMLNIIPKYRYDENIISFNCTSIRNSNKFKITGIKYEFNFTKLSSSNRDADCQSDFDKYESYLIKQDEALYLQNKVNCEYSMLLIEELYGPFNRDEIEFYRACLSKDVDEGDSIFNSFQTELIFNLFYKYLGDPKSIKFINSDQYIKLMIAAHRILKDNGLVVLPYVVSSKIIKMPTKKSINKKLVDMIVKDPLWLEIEDKYKDESILSDIMDKIAIAISSEYKIISYNEFEYHDRIINYDCSIIIAKEFMEFILMI